MPGCGGNCACSPAATAVETVERTPVSITVEDEQLKILLDIHFNGDSDQGNREAQQKEIFKRYREVYEKDTLVHIVETLGFALTDTNVEKRAKGTGLLAECIFQCPPGSLDDLEVDILMRFFCDRLKDHHSIQPLVIYAFLALSSYQNVRNDQIISMLQSIFTEVHIQSLLQADRRNVFNIFSNLLTTKLHVLETINADFVFGFIQAMDSERDPRNLLLCFNNSLKIIQSLDIKLFAEDFFEILSCYFPVDFRERAEEEFRIKKKDLVASLKNCLSATSLFGPYAVPLYLEKLSSDLMESKLDALLTFIACLKVYKPEDISLHIDDIWLAIRKDYLLSDFSELGDSYLVFVQELAISLCRLDDKSCIKKLIDFAVKDTLQTLKDPEMVIALPCANVIYHISQASHAAYDEVVHRLVTPLQTALEKYTSSAQRTNVMVIVSKVLSVAHLSAITAENKTLLLGFVNYLLPLIYDSLANTEGVPLKVLCLKCLEEIICKRASYPEIDFDALSIHALTALEADPTVPLLTAYQTFVCKLSLHQPESFKKDYLTLLKERTSKSKQILNLLPYASFEDKELQEQTYVQLNDLLRMVCGGCSVDEGADVLKCYKCVLERSVGYVPGHLCFVPLFSVISSQDAPDALVLNANGVLAVCYHSLNDTERGEVCKMACRLLLSDGNLQQLSLFNSSLPSLYAGDSFFRLSAIVKAVLTQAEISRIQQMDVDNICNKLVELMRRTSDGRVHQNLAITMASIVNKLPASSLLVQRYLEDLKGSLQSHSCKNHDIVVLGWLTKSLVLNWQSATTSAIDLMLECLNLPSLAGQCSESFGVIVKDSEFVFTKKSHAIMKPVYKQRYTEYIVPLLIAQYNSCPEQHKCFHMVALSTTLQAIPSRMVQKHMKSMMPLLMHSLTTCTTQVQQQQQQELQQQQRQQQQQQQELQHELQHEQHFEQDEQQQQIAESTLKTICSVVTQSKDNILDYVPTLISHLSKLVSHKSMNIRISALKSLTVLSTYTVHVVLPLRTEVLKRMQAVLDDGKRLVRKEAVLCSNAWHLLNSP